jgi:regulator of protease activity HflC (stomatin/prohibitin superfamily)
MLIIKDGKQVRAEIGLKTFVWPNESVVKFPSVMRRVEFKAMNVTKEMQGVSIEGYAFWQVYRKEDGPFRCYKYMQGDGANDNVKTLCESIVRNELANSNLNDVITKRDQLRENVKTELMPQLQGWGIWLETVELTEVKICSGTLFEDLQAEFRQETSLAANEKKISTN